MFTILKGIQVLAASTSDNIDELELSELYAIEQITTIRLKKVKISNFKHFQLDNHGKLAHKDEKISEVKPATTKRKSQFLILETESDYEPEEDDPLKL